MIYCLLNFNFLILTRKPLSSAHCYSWFHHWGAVSVEYSPFWCLFIPYFCRIGHRGQISWGKGENRVGMRLVWIPMFYFIFYIYYIYLYLACRLSASYAHSNIPLPPYLSTSLFQPHIALPFPCLILHRLICLSLLGPPLTVSISMDFSLNVRCLQGWVRPIGRSFWQQLVVLILITWVLDMDGATFVWRGEIWSFGTEHFINKKWYNLLMKGRVLISGCTANHLHLLRSCENQWGCDFCVAETFRLSIWQDLDR